MSETATTAPTSRTVSPVRSYNEWDPLEEVIVGTARGAVRHGYEPALAPYHPREQRNFVPTAFSHEEIDQAEAQLDGLAARLEREGVTVRRPEPLNHDREFATPEFVVASGHAQACPRDVLLVVGDEIIEAPMAQRSRYFEYRAYRPLVREYFRAGARWTAVPKPLMDDTLYEVDYSTADGPYAFPAHMNLREIEPCFDAACFIRCGRDIFWQPDIVSNALGADWLQRHLGSAFRVRRVEFFDPHPEHADTTLIPLRPGLALVNPDRPFKDGMRALFEMSGWQLVEPPRSVYDVQTGRHALGISWWISLNILSLSPDLVIVESAERPLMEFLGTLGVDVIPVDFVSVYRFGGSFHCCTVDVRRDGVVDTYFDS